MAKLRVTETFTPHGSDLFGGSAERAHSSTLGDEFLIPPFSILNAREGWWQERKRAWLAIGIQSELGRGGGANTSGGTSDLAGVELLSGAER